MAAFPIVIKAWAGTMRHDMRYIRYSLPSLLESDLPTNAEVCIVDDCSPNPRLRPFIESLAKKYDNVRLWFNEENLGPNKGQEVVIPRIWSKYPNAPYLICCDDDVIYHPGWLQRLIRVYEDANAVGLRAVFSALNTPARPHFAERQLATSIVLLKERQMALNWLVPREVYDQVGPFRDAGVAYDTDYCDRMAELDIPVACLKPSWVQNIGYQGAYQSDDTLTAHDFIGRRDAWLVLRDQYYAIRRIVLKTPEWVPNGRFKNALKRLARPFR